MAKRSFWGWGNEGEGPNDEQAQAMLRTLSGRFGAEPGALRPAPTLADITLPDSRVKPPSTLEGLITVDPFERANHTYGKSYRDIVRAVGGDFSNAPDAVAFPTNEGEVASLLDWCSDARIAAIPYGGGSSVVGGTEAALGDGYTGALSIDLSRLDQLLEIDRTSRAARFQAGIYGPALEDALRPHGLTLRHFPQSFQFSTLGGWIATRSGGHYATLYTHIDDFVQSLRVVTPHGVSESRRLPGSGAGPSPDRMFIGSEGTLGIITEAWMRLQDRPKFRASTSVRFEGEDGFHRGAEAVRLLTQSGLFPTNCRLLDPLEAQNSGAAAGDAAVLVLGFESADHALDPWMQRATELCRDAGGIVPDDAVRTRTDEGAGREGAAGAWRQAFLNMPYALNVFARGGIVGETFETAISWDRFPEFDREVRAAVHAALDRVCGGGSLSCRFTHAYPDGAAPYYTFAGAGKPGSELSQWDEIKAAAMEAVVSAGGTVTHHHAVGRVHRPGYDRQRPEPFAVALRAAKRALDPAGILNPGVLIDP